MLFINEQCNSMYNLIYNWLANHTPGSRCHIGLLKEYQKNLWNPIINVIDNLLDKQNLSNMEKEFLELVFYSGPIYRIQEYNPRNKGYVYENEYYQSWSKSIEGVTNVSNINGDILLIVGQASKGIDLIGFLYFLSNYELVTQFQFEGIVKNPNSLKMYFKEEEIVNPIQFKFINDIAVINKQKLNDWKNNKKSIPKNKWKRNSIN